MAAVNLVKGDSCDIKFDELPTNELMIGVGWTPMRNDTVDLDMGIVQLDRDKKILDVINFQKKHLSDGSTKYSGDDVTGESSDGGFDEKMWVSFDKVRQDCVYMVCTINSYRGQTFNDVSGTLFGVGYTNKQQKPSSLFGRISNVLNPKELETMLYESKFNDNDRSTGIATAVFKRIDAKNWGMNIVWKFVHARTAKDIPQSFFTDLI